MKIHPFDNRPGIVEARKKNKIMLPLELGLTEFYRVNIKTIRFEYQTHATPPAHITVEDKGYTLTGYAPYDWDPSRGLAFYELGIFSNYLTTKAL